MLTFVCKLVFLLGHLGHLGHSEQFQSSQLEEWHPRQILDARDAASDDPIKALAEILLAAPSQIGVGYSARGIRRVQQELGPSMALEVGDMLPNRRSVLAAFTPMLAFPGIATAAPVTLRFVGVYDDPQHPDCRRFIKPQGQGSTIAITGKDEIGGKEWKVFGEVKGDEVVIDFSPKGGPTEVVAKFAGDVESFENENSASFTFPDGNVWTRLSQKNIVRAAGFSRDYYVLDGKTKLKRKILMSGYRARIIGTEVPGGPEFEIKGKYEADDKLVIDFSPLGGKSAVTCVKTTEGLEFSDGQLWKYSQPR